MIDEFVNNRPSGHLRDQRKVTLKEFYLTGIICFLTVLIDTSPITWVLIGFEMDEKKTRWIYVLYQAVFAHCSV